MNRESTIENVKAQSVRWTMPVLVVGLLGVALVLIALAPDRFRGMQVVASMAAIAAASLALLIWFLMFSGLSRRARTIGIAGLAVLLLLSMACVRVDGFDGQMLPIFAWRWTPTAEQQFAARRPPAATNVQTDAASSDLSGNREEDYPGFLGRNRLGVVAGIELETDWNRHPPRELWRQPVGLGWSAMAVAGNRAITQEQRGDHEVVVCYDLHSGQELWSHVDAARFSETLGGDGPRATPTIHEGRAYTLGATGILNCLDAASGRRIWNRNILDDAGADNISWGMASSPLVVGKTVVVCAGGRNDKSLWAYRIEDGEVAWHAGSDRAAYVSPMLTTLAGVPQILMYNAVALASHDPASGKVLWRYEWRADQEIKCSQPVVPAEFEPQESADEVLISSGYAVGSVLLGVTRTEQGEFQLEPRWETRQLRAKFSNNIVRGDHIYGLDEGILVCVDLADGKRLWKEGRYGYGQLLQVGQQLLIQAESGDVVLLEVSPRGPKELSRLSALSSKTWNNPALAGDLLLVRNDREAACYRLATKKPKADSDSQ